jgi:hypothetical protein
MVTDLQANFFRLDKKHGAPSTVSGHTGLKMTTDSFDAESRSSRSGMRREIVRASGTETMSADSVS